MKRALFACFIVASCAPSSDRKPSANPPPIVKLAANGESPYLHDFGMVLTSGQSLVHTFRLANPSDRPRKILGARAMIPCCSSMAPLPEVVPANGSIEVAVGLRTIGEQGPKAADFLVAWDDPDRPTIRFSIQALLVAEQEVEAEDGSDRRLLVHRAGKQRFRVITRRKSDAARGGIARVDVDQPLGVRLLDSEPGCRTEAGGIRVCEQHVEVHLPEGESVGLRTAMMRFVGEDDREWDHRIQWEIVPPVRVTPAVLVHPRSGELSQHAIVVRAEDGRAFRILGIEPASYADGAADFPSKSSPMHRLELGLPPVSEGEGGAEAVVVMTDHPEMARVHLRILRFSSKEGASDGS